ncbi:MAG: FHA domain-containing protein [Acidobacteria bacterium]|nr:MAG: FHA domain-containing protein [Acidobacteriota bacterium]
MIAIELIDVGIAAFDDSGLVLPPDPGYALIEGEELLTGHAALGHGRLKPRRVHHRFWDELDTTPLPRPFPRGLNRADLAHAHLSRIWTTIPNRPTSAQEGRDGARLILAVPGCFSADQLSLILGIAKACEMPVVGMVDSGVAASAHGYPGPRLLHLDLLLHRVVLTEMSQQDGEVVRRRVETIEEAGLVELLDLWAKQIADLFIHETRFDPLHSATTEQSLYDHLPETLARLRRADSTLLLMEVGGKEKSVELGHRQLVAATDRIYQSILQLVRSAAEAGPAATLLLSHRITQLPGLEQQLVDAVGTAMVTLSAGAAAAGALEHRRLIASETEEIPFVTRLPAIATIEAASPAVDEDTEESPSGPTERRPTHVVHEGFAYPITEQLLALGTELPEGSRGIEILDMTEGVSPTHCSIFLSEGRVLVEDHSTDGTYLNDEMVEGTATLETGDRLRLGSPGVELQLIAVEENDGTP